MNKLFGHFKMVCIHKWWVFYYCCKIRMPWRGFLHDWSKFSPTEFWESVRYYTGTHSPIDECKKDKGYSMAWLHHKGHNKHHYEYWVDNFDKGGERLHMPQKYLFEMLCDYVGAGRAYNGKAFSWEKEWDWWVRVRNHRQMHSFDKKFIEQCFAKCLTEQRFLTRVEVNKLYDNCLIDTSLISVSLKNEPFERND